MTLALDSAVCHDDFDVADMSAPTSGNSKPAKARKTSEARSIELRDVPPWCLLSDGLTPEEAATETVKRVGITDPAHAVGLLWKLRQVAAAEGFSATQADAESDLGDVATATHIPTHKQHQAAKQITVKVSLLRRLRRECKKFRLRAKAAETELRREHDMQQLKPAAPHPSKEDK